MDQSSRRRWQRGVQFASWKLRGRSGRDVTLVIHLLQVLSEAWLQMGCPHASYRVGRGKGLWFSLEDLQFLMSSESRLSLLGNKRKNR